MKAGVAEIGLKAAQGFRLKPVLRRGWSAYRIQFANRP